MSKDFIKFEDVFRSYGDKVVLDDIDMSISKGEFVTVVGPSGCGKSTLLRLILGEDTATKGNITVDGEPVQRPCRDRGVVYQNYSLFPHLRALDNVTIGHRLKGWPWQWRSMKNEAEDMARKALDEMGMLDHIDKFPHELSGGQRQRVAIAQALVQEPKVLCMDEPFSALDPGTRENLQMYLLELWEKRNMTVFFVTHELEEAVFLGTRIVALSQYYTTDLDDIGQGAKIVFDRDVRSPGGNAIGRAVKHTPEFLETIADVRREAFDPAHRQHLDSFDLSHSDSWRTL